MIFLRVSLFRICDVLYTLLYVWAIRLIIVMKFKEKYNPLFLIEVKPLICSAKSKTLMGMLVGRLLVGTGMGLGPPVASLYVTEVQCSL